ncbi:hypothetical protein [Exiguobacterium sp. s181]|uniref:hypothetical protein n=1 Tax=Exiguobacterium sp. s181 TaxID=2751288 RepID=UPI001BE58B19|nr:hypothetical protein [Exiguobacterium sp. s181]
MTKENKKEVVRKRPRKTYTLSPVTVENLRELSEIFKEGESRIIDQAVAAFYKEQTGISNKEYADRVRELDK